MNPDDPEAWNAKVRHDDDPSTTTSTTSTTPTTLTPDERLPRLLRLRTNDYFNYFDYFLSDPKTVVPNLKIPLSDVGPQP